MPGPSVVNDLHERPARFDLLLAQPLEEELARDLTWVAAQDEAEEVAEAERRDDVEVAFAG